MSVLRKLSFPLLAVGLMGIPVQESQAQDAEAFYKKNNQMTLIVGFGAGSGYDRWARSVARHYPEHIPGKPNIIVKNMTGAGSLVAANHLANVSPKDGSVIGVFTRNIPAQALIGREGVKFDPREFGWIGSPTISSRVCVVLDDTGIKSVEDLRQKEVPVGGTGPTSAPSFMPVVLNNLLGTKFKVIEGYRSSEEVHLALERGEVSGICQSYSAVQKLHPEWLEQGKLRVLFNMETKRNPKLDGVPSVFEFIEEKENRQILQFITASTEFGRPFAAPPGISEERLEVLRTAFNATMKDPDFLKEAEKQKMDVVVTTGKELETLVKELYEIPQPVVEKARALMPSK